MIIILKKYCLILACSGLFFLNAELLSSADVQIPPADFRPVFQSGNFSSTIRKMSVKYGIDESIIHRIIEVESNFNTCAVSRCDARGLMQVTRRTWDWICEQYLGVGWDFEQYAFNPEKNIEVGTRFLRWIYDYLETYAQELNGAAHDLALACYNAGPGAVRKYGFRVPPYAETRHYVYKVNRLLSEGK